MMCPTQPTTMLGLLKSLPPRSSGTMPVKMAPCPHDEPDLCWTWRRVNVIPVRVQVMASAIS